MAPRDSINDGESKNVPTENAAKKLHYIRVRKKKWGRYGAEIRGPGRKNRFWLGTFDTTEATAKAYDAAARNLRGAWAKTNFPAPILEPVHELSRHNQNCSIQNSSAPQHQQTNLSVPLDLRSLVKAVPTNLHARQPHAAARSAKISKQMKINIDEQVKPFGWTHAYRNAGVRVQGVGAPSRFILPIPNPHPCPSNLLDYDTHLRQPQKVMALLGETVVSHKSHDRVPQGMVNNFTSATSDCDSYSSSEVLNTQTSHPPVGGRLFNWNLPAPEMEYFRAREFDLNIPAPEE